VLHTKNAKSLKKDLKEEKKDLKGGIEENKFDI